MNPISSRQVTGVLLVVLSGWSLTMTAQDGRDGWIVLLLAGLCSLPVAALCCLASERMPQGDWFQLPRAAFGTVGGALYMWTLAALAFWSLCMTVLSGVIFLRTVSGGIWPVWLLTAALLVCAAASAQHGVRQLALWAQPMVWLVVLALLLSLVLSWKQLDFYELRPILSGGVKDLPKRVYLLLSAPFGEVFYAAAVLGGQGTRIRNGLLRACVLAGVLLSVLYLRNICLLGAEGARGADFIVFCRMCAGGEHLPEIARRVAWSNIGGTALHFMRRQQSSIWNGARAVSDFVPAGRCPRGRRAVCKSAY